MKKLLILCLAFVSLGVQAQRRLTLAECLTLAEESNYGLQASKLDIEQARWLKNTAWNLDKTSLSLSQDPTSGGSPDNSLTLSQSLDFPTVYKARKKTLQAEVGVAESRLNVARNDLRFKVATLYENMVYVQEQMRLLTLQDTVLKAYLHKATVRYKAGEARQLEQLTANRLLQNNLQEKQALQSTFWNLQQQLSALLGAPGEAVAPAEDSLQVLPLEVPLALNFEQSAEGQLLRSEAVVTERRVTEAKTDYLPSFNLGLRHQLVISGWNPYGIDRSKFDKGSFMGFEVGVSFPLFTKATRAKVRAAKLQSEMAVLALRQAELNQQTAYSQALEQYRQAKQRLNYYSQVAMPEVQKMVRIAQVSYENADIGYLEYVNTLQERISTRLKQAEATHELNQSLLQLQRLVGQ